MNIDLSVVLIIKNESNKLLDCLKTIRDLECEIVVVDSGSTDDSINIAKEFTNKVFSHTEWQGFGVQRQIAQSYATKSWVLMIDADERLTSSLQAEICKAVTSDKYDGYYLPRRNYFLGKELKFGGGVDKVLRLYKKDKGKCDNSQVHEKVLIDGKVAHLKNPLLHYSTDTVFAAINKMNSYSELASKKQSGRNKKLSLITAVVHGLWTFFRIYVIQLGILDGNAGFILAVLKAEGSYYKYVKLLMKDKGESL